MLEGELRERKDLVVLPSIEEEVVKTLSLISVRMIISGMSTHRCEVVVPVTGTTYGR